MNPARYAWLDGELVEWDSARLHVDTHCVLGGLNAYEVVGGIWDDESGELFLFRLNDHLDRLWRSAKVMRLAERYPQEELADAALELVARNGFREDVLVRLVWYLGSGPIFSHLPHEIETGVFMVVKSQARMQAARRGLHVCVSGWRRLPDSAAPPRVKSGANYQNVRLAQIQAHVDGYDDALLVNDGGKVCEAPLSNLFVVRRGQLVTPSVTSGILEGITRQTLLELASEIGVEIIERELDRSELYLADEAFLAGTGKEIWPILSIDRYPVGDGATGPLTTRIQSFVDALMRGRAGHSNLLSPVYGRVGYGSG